MAGGYGVPARSHRHPRATPPGPTGTADVVALAVVVAVAVATRWWLVVPVAGVVVGVARSPRLAAAAVVLAVVAVPRATTAWADLGPDELGPFRGWAEVVIDPQPSPGATRVVLAIEGERYEAWVRGRVRSRRAATWQAGDRVMVAGTREALDDDRRLRVAPQHVVGALAAEWFGDVAAGDRAATASNRVRAVIAAAPATSAPTRRP